MQRFESARLKISRARLHIDEAERIHDSVLRHGAFRLEAQQNDAQSRLDLVLVGDVLPPNALPLVIGDAAHNLRSALDHVACDLAALNGQSSKGVAFPIATDAADLDRQIKARKFDRAPDYSIAFLKELKPYPSGNDVIVGLHRLDIDDKHIRLVAIGHVMSDAASLISSRGTVTVLSTPSPSTFQLGEVLASLDSGGEALRVGDQLHGSFAIAFGDGPFGGHPVIPFLRQVADYVEHVIEAFSLLTLDGGAVVPPPSAGFVRHPADLLRVK